MLAVPCDVNDRAQLEAVVDATWKEFGRIDLLVNNAGGTPPRPALRTSEKMFEAAFHFNVTSAFLLSRLVDPEDARRRRRRDPQHLVGHVVAGRQGLRRVRHREGGALRT